MAVDLKIKTNSKQVSQKFKKFQSVLPRVIDKGLKQAGFQLLDIIRTKTQKGIDFRDRPFAPYSSGYLKKLNKEGKSTNVDLFYSGRMLGSLTPSSTVKKSGRNKVSLAFSNSQMRQRALFNQVLNDPRREFFGFNNRTEKIISKQFNRFVEKELRKYGETSPKSQRQMWEEAFENPRASGSDENSHTSGNSSVNIQEISSKDRPKMPTKLERIKKKMDELQKDYQRQQQEIEERMKTNIEGQRKIQELTDTSVDIEDFLPELSVLIEQLSSKINTLEDKIIENKKNVHILLKFFLMKYEKK